MRTLVQWYTYLYLYRPMHTLVQWHTDVYVIDVLARGMVCSSYTACAQILCSLFVRMLFF
jgi:hypothetical protein